VASKLKKVLRDEGGVITEEKKKDFESELGDVLWYLSKLAGDLGLTMGNIADKNIEKTASRMKRGKIGGSGDNR
jgi:NTP pyrophosphatase (non-canonical NTP hydrolase)